MLNLRFASLAKCLSCHFISHVLFSGPYGSDVLFGVQTASDRVWKEVCANEKDGVGHDWLKATIQITAHSDKPWTAHAVKQDGSAGKEYYFSPRK